VRLGCILHPASFTGGAYTRHFVGRVAASSWRRKPFPPTNFSDFRSPHQRPRQPRRISRVISHKDASLRRGQSFRVSPFQGLPNPSSSPESRASRRISLRSTPLNTTPHQLLSNRGIEDSRIADTSVSWDLFFSIPLSCFGGRGECRRARKCR
jgi:hypothetical protein